jgi:hypothetical protein
MWKYLLMPLPALIGVFLRWGIHLLGDPKIDREEIHPRHVYHFADFWLLLGCIVTGLLLFGFVVADFFDWVDRRSRRRSLVRGLNDPARR